MEAESDLLIKLDFKRSFRHVPLLRAMMQCRYKSSIDYENCVVFYAESPFDSKVLDELQLIHFI
jgi:hypothetical protein